MAYIMNIKGLCNGTLILKIVFAVSFLVNPAVLVVVVFWGFFLSLPGTR